MKLLRATVTSKGQVTLPKALRESLGIHEGDHVEFSIDSPSNAKMRKLAASGSSAGILMHLGKGEPLTVEAMDEAIRERSRENHRSRKAENL